MDRLRPLPQAGPTRSAGGGGNGSNSEARKHSVEASVPILGDGSRSGVKARIGMNDLLKLAIEGHGSARRWEQICRFRASASITGAIWSLKASRDCSATCSWKRDPRPAADDHPVPAVRSPHDMGVEPADDQD